MHEAAWLHIFGDSLGIMVVFKYLGETGSAGGIMATYFLGTVFEAGCQIKGNYCLLNLLNVM